MVSLYNVAWYMEGGTGLLLLNEGGSSKSGVKFVGGIGEENMCALGVEKPWKALVV